MVCGRGGLVVVGEGGVVWVGLAWEGYGGQFHIWG